MRKMFDSVSIREMDPENPLPDYRMLEGRIQLQATMNGASFHADAPLGLEILVGEDALEFCVRNQNDIDDRRTYRLDLADIPEWETYKVVSFHEIRGQRPEIIESFLRRAFADPHSEEWNAVAERMGDRIGVRVGNELGLVLGETPHDIESKKLFVELAQVALGYSNAMKMAHRAAELTQEYRLR